MAEIESELAKYARKIISYCKKMGCKECAFLGKGGWCAFEAGYPNGWKIPRAEYKPRNRRADDGTGRMDKPF